MKSLDELMKEPMDQSLQEKYAEEISKKIGIYITNIPNFIYGSIGYDVNGKLEFREYSLCQHDRATYVGFTDTFDYCTKCNEKLV